MLRGTRPARAPPFFRVSALVYARTTRGGNRMRYYEVTAQDGPHVTRLFFERGDALEALDRQDHIYTHAEMVAHPELAAALERFYDPANYEYQMSNNALELREALEDHVAEGLSRVGEMVEDLSDLPEDNPVRQTVGSALELLKQLDVLIEGIERLRPGGLRYTDLPESALYVFWNREQEELAAAKKSQEAVADQVGVSA